jgi:hypothetical protein
MPMHIGNHFPLQPSFNNLTKLPQFLQVYQIWKREMPLQTNSFKFSNVH